MLELCYEGYKILSIKLGDKTTVKASKDFRTYQNTSAELYDKDFDDTILDLEAALRKRCGLVLIIKAIVVKEKTIRISIEYDAPKIISKMKGYVDFANIKIDKEKDKDKQVCSEGLIMTADEERLINSLCNEAFLYAFRGKFKEYSSDSLFGAADGSKK